MAVATAPAELAGLGTVKVLPSSAEDDKCYTFAGTVQLDTAEQAEVLCKALEVDSELRPDQVNKHLSVEGNSLIINFAATELRMLRGAVGNFYDMLALAVRTMEQFGKAQ